MADDKTKKLADAKRISLKEDYEFEYWKKRFRVQRAGTFWGCALGRTHGQGRRGLPQREKEEVGLLPGKANGAWLHGLHTKESVAERRRETARQCFFPAFGFLRFLSANQTMRRA